MSKLTLTQANAICEAAFAKGAELGLKPLCVVVLDGGGHLIATHRQDGASNLRPQIAFAKAAGAIGLGVSSRKIAEMASERPAFVASLSALAPRGMTPAAGGIIVVGSDGDPVGAVGCSGDTSDNDEACVLAGIAASGLDAQV